MEIPLLSISVKQNLQTSFSIRDRKAKYANLYFRPLWLGQFLRFSVSVHYYQANLKVPLNSAIVKGPRLLYHPLL